jgi:hypothetical protein
MHDYRLHVLRRNYGNNTSTGNNITKFMDLFNCEWPLRRHMSIALLGDENGYSQFQCLHPAFVFTHTFNTLRDYDDDRPET